LPLGLPRRGKRASEYHGRNLDSRRRAQAWGDQQLRQYHPYCCLSESPPNSEKI
jgi:hypothetical protein